MRKIVITSVVALLAFCAPCGAQNVLGRLSDRAKQAAENAVGNKIENAINGAIDGVGKKKDKPAKNEAPQAPASTDDDIIVPSSAPAQTTSSDDIIAPSATTSSVKNDFVRGEFIFFNDDVKDEQIGEFPSKWDLIEGDEIEVVALNGEKVITFGGGGRIIPLMEETPYLPDEFTVEFDIWSQYVPKGSSDGAGIDFHFLPQDDNEYASLVATINPAIMSGEFGYTADWVVWANKPDTPSARNAGEGTNGKASYQIVQPLMKVNTWTHIAISFNKRAFKLYVNGTRIFNLPNVKQPGSVRICAWNRDDQVVYIKNFIMAKGAVKLYDRNVSSMTAVEKAMQETGKFVTNNILFETGKATLKPESMADIQSVAEFMKKNPSVRFEVQGHCDNQGSDSINDPLSQKRAEAIVAELVKLGVDEWNLRAVGKGSHEPVADNSTEEGRAKNRRVEFIKK